MEYMDQNGRKFHYHQGARVYLDGDKDIGTPVQPTSPSPLPGYTKKGPAWYKDVAVRTPYGDFEVQLFGGKPDIHKVALAAKVEEYLGTSIEHVIDIVFAYHSLAEKTWASDMHEFGIPKTINRRNLLSFLSPTINVDEVDGEYLCSISFDVPYDPEHGLHLAFEDNRVTTLNESKFRIEDGQLKFEDE